ncbi:beta-2 adrenergic receptor-like [Acanthaster planci]|uniref:Beta-2 adrenergic receptor-like n=1 Tax=Acanthaster planci TaxID=133434 RepID=A0A8B7Y8S3_ACAPL|nr:beta-2 adrenergic receptor-like [Acanthaster planci]
MEPQLLTPCLSAGTNLTMEGELLPVLEFHTSASLATVILRTLSIVIAFLLIITSNFVNLIVLPRTNCFGEVTQFLLMSLAVEDFLIGVCLAFAIWPAVADFWPFGDAVCKIIGSLGTLLAAASSLTLMCISVDRFLAVTRPLRYVTIVTLKRARFVITAVWLVCFIFIAFVDTATWPPLQNIEYDTVLCNCIVKFFDDRVFPRALAAAAVCVVLPSIIITATNAKLLVVTIAHAKRIDALPRNHNFNDGGRRISSREFKAVRTTLVITGIYYMAWAPFLATQIYLAFSSVAIADWLHFLSGYLVLSNSWWNVFIYSFMNKSFRKTLADFVAAKCACYQRSNDGEMMPTQAFVVTDGRAISTPQVS